MKPRLLIMFSWCKLLVSRLWCKLETCTTPIFRLIFQRAASRRKKVSQDWRNKELRDAIRQLELERNDLRDRMASMESELRRKIDGISVAVQDSCDRLAEQLSARVAELPISWTPRMVSRKLQNPEFQHPNGIADFVPKMDDHGNVIRVDGKLLPEAR